MTSNDRSKAALALRVSTLFGIGNLPGAPGTAGSFVGLALYVITLILGGPSGVVTVLAWLLVIAVWSSSAASQELKQKDPPSVVIDEVVGMWITLAGTENHGPMLLVAFLFFRFFDVLKPFPIRKAESLPGGWGIVLDDVIAGIYANMTLRILSGLLTFAASYFKM